MRTRTPRPVRRAAAWAATALLLGLALTACTGDDASPEATGAPAQLGEELPAAEIADYTGTYQVQSVFRGEQECLDANYQDPDTERTNTFMAPCDGQADQAWQITAVEPGRYQIQSERPGEAVCLNGNDRTSPVHDGAAFAETCRLIADQVWSITVVGDGSLRFHSALYEQSACLESNDPESEAHSGGVFMDDCADASGQFWTLTPSA